MLRALPFQTIGDIARHGLELHVYCPRCYSTRRLVDLERWADRCFATARFRCTGTRHDGTPCRNNGMPVVRPAELLQVGGPVTLAFLTCPRCIWEIDQAQLDKPPWSGKPSTIAALAAVAAWSWHIHGPAWRPSSSSPTCARSGGLPVAWLLIFQQSSSPSNCRRILLEKTPSQLLISAMSNGGHL